MKHERHISIFLIFLTVIVLAVNIPRHIKEEASKTPVSYTAYIVNEGDTLWQIATESNAHGIYDTRRIVSDICEASECTAEIYAGQELQIPQYDIKG